MQGQGFFWDQQLTASITLLLICRSQDWVILKLWTMCPMHRIRVANFSSRNWSPSNIISMYHISLLGGNYKYYTKRWNSDWQCLISDHNNSFWNIINRAIHIVNVKRSQGQCMIVGFPISQNQFVHKSPQVCTIILFRVEVIQLKIWAWFDFDVDR